MHAYMYMRQIERWGEPRRGGQEKEAEGRERKERHY